MKLTEKQLDEVFEQMGRHDPACIVTLAELVTFAATEILRLQSERDAAQQRARRMALRARRMQNRFVRALSIREERQRVK
jgi:hypothetical protein